VEINGHGPLYGNIDLKGLRKTRKTCQCRPSQRRDLKPDLLNTKVCNLLDHDFRGANIVVLMNKNRLTGRRRLRTSTLKGRPVAFSCSD
jgi:hypothetical protein